VYPAPVAYQLLATRFVDGAPFPTSANSGGVFLTYFEVMSNNIWLPEDLLTGIAKYANEPGDFGTPGLWGTDLGQQLRMWYIAKGRPLIWGDQQDGPMLLDPLVASRLNSFSHTIDKVDLDAFALAWRLPSWEPKSFEKLADYTAPYLHFNWPSWARRAACEAHERNASVHVMGTDELGECVYWTSVPVPQRWECLNDGTCVPSLSTRAVFESQAQCTAECGQSWECVRNIGLHISHEVAYCVPSTPAAFPLVPFVPVSVAGQRYGSASACEAGCVAEDSGRSMLCHNWVSIISTTLWLGISLQLCGFCAVRKWVGPRQQFKHGLLHCCKRQPVDDRPLGRCSCSFAGRPICCTGRPWSSCLLNCCCPCFQWYRVLSFVLQCPRSTWGGVCSVCGALLFVGCCCINPLGLLIYLLCGSCKNACTRYQLRKRLKIEGSWWQDLLTHCFAGTCAACQEALEISSAGHSGVLYTTFNELDIEHPADTPIMPLGTSASTSAATAQAPAATQHAHAASGTSESSRPATSRPLVEDQLLGHGYSLIAPVSSSSSTTQVTQAPESVTSARPSVSRPLLENLLGPAAEAASHSDDSSTPVLAWGPGHPDW
jgi:Cys-rich protein (TIGR01571 family)